VIVSCDIKPGKSEERATEEKFRLLADAWKAESAFLSSITDMAMLESYQKIIALGPPVIPLLLRELEREPDQWFWALKILTGEDPVPVESRGDIEEMTKHWIKWGRAQGHVNVIS